MKNIHDFWFFKYCGAAIVYYRESQIEIISMNNIKARFFLQFILLFFIGLPLSAQTNRTSSGDAYEPNYRIRTIVLDPGHGGAKPGAKGTKALEKDIVLQLSLKLGKAIERALPDVKVYYTRTTDVDMDLYKRTEFANDKKADIFISIHCNAAANKRVRRGKGYVSVVNPDPHGTETLVLGFNQMGQQDAALRENADILLEENHQENYAGFDPNDPESYLIFSLMKNQYREQSIRLASAIQKEFTSMGRVDRGVKEQTLAVLARAGMPAVLTEVGFLSNPQEEQYMLSEQGQSEIVTNLLNAIINYKKQTER